jgi:exoribonuclease R
MRIPGILELNSRIRYGFTSKNVPIYLFRPLDTSLGLCIVGSSSRAISINVLAVVDVPEFSKTNLSRGNLVRIIGNCGEYSAEKEAILCRYSATSWKGFDISTINIPHADIPTLDGETFNIDPIGCEDIDDVFTIGNDGFYYITIADVGSWFESNTTHSFIQTASNIGQTFYNNGRVVNPLLPIEKECSLLPGKKRLGISLKFKWDGCKISDVSFQRVYVVNKTTFNYESIYNSRYANLLSSISSYLAGRKHVMDSHEWVEQLMLFYNVEVAKVLVEKNNGILRVHEEPDMNKLEMYKNILGLDSKYIAYKSAEYMWVNETGEKRHWGLEKEYYCHATSPIRRYADILNQLILTDRWNPIWFIESSKLNNLSKNSKKYNRDEFFIDKLLNNGESRCVQCVIVNNHRIWIPDWKRLITYKNEKEPGTHGVVRFSLDMNQPTWKRRMVFKFEDTMNLE